VPVLQLQSISTRVTRTNRQHVQAKHRHPARAIRLLENGRRPVYGIAEKFQNDPHWRELILFYDFHGDNGAGIGASHQTGWTGLVAWLVKSLKVLKSQDVLERGYDAVAMRIIRDY
jgi:hypothetical protein